MSPSTNIEGIIANIKEPRFGVAFFKQFTIVCNALDNLEARRYVNRMCLAAEVPLVESGSTGYDGQCSVIGKGVECYDCTDRPAPRTYAVCTIRSTPDKPVHCIVWAKFLFSLIFGEDDESNVLRDLDGGGAGGAPEIEHQNGHHETNHTSVVANGHSTPADQSNGNGEEKSQTPEHDQSTPFKRKTPAKRVRFVEQDTAQTFATRVCQRVFIDDIEEQRAMKDLWTSREAPSIFDVSAVADLNPEIDLKKVNLLEQTVWDKEHSATIFKATLKNIVNHRRAQIGSMSFDKDDRDAMMFVSAAANLRANAYGVALQSPFDTKGIAGNIIHAIATTNAMVGGMVVIEVLKIIAGDGDLSRNNTVFVSNAPRGNSVRVVICPEPLAKPNPKCIVCSERQLHLQVDVGRHKLKDFVVDILSKLLSILEPSISVATGEQEGTVYESGAGLEEDEIEDYKSNLNKCLKELGVENGSQLVVDDFAQKMRCTIHVTDKDMASMVLTGDIGASEQGSEEAGSSKDNAEEEAPDEVDEVLEVPLTRTDEAIREDALMAALASKVMVKDHAEGVQKGDSRKRELEIDVGNGEQPKAKKARVAGSTA